MEIVRGGTTFGYADGRQAILGNGKIAIGPDYAYSLARFASGEVKVWGFAEFAENADELVPNFGEGWVFHPTDDEVRKGGPAYWCRPADAIEIELLELHESGKLQEQLDRTEYGRFRQMFAASYKESGFCNCCTRSN